MGAENEEAQEAVEALVAHYEAKARAVSRAGVAVGAFAGVVVGSIPLSPLRAAWPIPSSYGFATLLGGLVVGVLIGYVVGDPRGKLYQRMAEQSRLQLRLEQRISQNDARMAQLLTALTARAAAAAPRPSPPQQPAPVPTVAPIQPLVRAPQPLQAAPSATDFDAPSPRLRTVAAVEPPASPAPPLSPPISG